MAARISLRMVSGLGAVVGVLVFAAALLVSSAPASSRAAAEVLPAGQTLYGASYDEWLSRWLKWAFTTPAATNPLAKPKDCKVAPQLGTKVWLLSASSGGKITISCTIPAGRPLYVPIAGLIGTEDEKFDTFAELRSAAQTVFKDTRVLRASIDGVPVSSMRAYEATTRDLLLDLPKDNIFGAPEGKLKAIAAGYSLLVTGLKPGKHKIITYTEARSKGAPVFKAGVTYLITIEGGQAG